MRVRLTVTLDIDPEVWSTEYGVEAARIRDDVRHHLANVMHEHYVTDLGVARETVVRRESSHRVGNAFS
jgi:hypothetical protein